jgi:5-methyltetrahydropteroyltriglutamate--homocysteine methyltransferase
VLIPGVVDSTTNFIEHPEVIAQRIARYAEAAGRERVLKGTDCPFGKAGPAATSPAITRAGPGRSWWPPARAVR